MSCLSRLLGLICAVVPGLLFLAFSVRFFTLWPDLGFVTGPLYSLVSFITGAICLYLGVSILFAGNKNEDVAPIAATAPELSPETVRYLAPEPVAAPMPDPLQPILTTQNTEAPSSIFAKSTDEGFAPVVPAETPESRIRQLAATRPNWQVTAAQLAHLANLNMGVADATAREMVNRGTAQVQTGPNGETIYVFDLTTTISPDFE